MYSMIADRVYLARKASCTESGVCSCNELDELRGDWRTTGLCLEQCIAKKANVIGNRLGDDCAIVFTTLVSRLYTNETSIMCALQGTVIQVSSAFQIKTATFLSAIAFGVLALLWA